MHLCRDAVSVALDYLRLRINVDVAFCYVIGRLLGCARAIRPKTSC
jgi:hypothetical protein